MPRKKKLISIGVMIFNEEGNIRELLDNVIHQTVNKYIYEIIVVSSGSTDKSNDIVEKFCKTDKRIKLITERKRKGKSHAVNIFLAQAKQMILVLVSADVILKRDTLEKLIKPLEENEIGIVGSHPIPTNDPYTFFGYTSHLLWRLHHEISLTKPKMGEMISFRKVFHKIPALSAVDEVNIESVIRGQGYKAKYAPDAIIYNKGPENLKEFISSRRRIFYGHLATKYEYSYEVSTLNSLSIFLLLFKNFKPTWRNIIWLPIIICLEAYSRFRGFLDYKYNLKKHTIWDVTPSTKKIILAKNKAL
jgi:poly-beta-1,6-N-acetyl-D-glucosamine synthase